MLSSKCFQVAALVIATMGLGLAPAGDAMAGSCNSNRSYNDGWQNRSHNVSYHSGNHYRNNSHRDYSHSRVKASYRNDSVRFSVSVGSHRSSHDYHRPRYRSSSCSSSGTVVYHTPQHNPQPSGYWKRVYHSPVYETRYASCGTPYRVCIRAGYYERVWVSTGHRY